MNDYNPTPIQAAINVIVILGVLIGATLYFTFHPVSWSPLGSIKPVTPVHQYDVPDGWELTPLGPDTQRSA